MAWPLSPLTTYLSGSVPAIKADDLMDFQQAINYAFLGYYTYRGLHVDGSGGVDESGGPVPAGQVRIDRPTPIDTNPRLRILDSAGNARAVLDKMGYDMARLGRFDENWASAGDTPATGKIAIASPIASYPLWQASDTSGGNLQAYFDPPQTGGTPLAARSLRLDGAGDNVAGHRLAVGRMAPDFPAWFTSVDASFEWDVTIISPTNARLILGFLGGGIISNLFGGGLTDSILVCNTLSPSGANGNWQLLVSNSGASQDLLDTGVAVVNGGIYKMKLEIHGSLSPVSINDPGYAAGAALVIFSVNGATVKSNAGQSAGTIKMPSSNMYWTNQISTTAAAVNACQCRISNITGRWNRQIDAS